MSKKRDKDPKTILEDLLNNWEGQLRNNFEIDSFEKQVSNIIMHWKKQLHLHSFRS